MSNGSDLQRAEWRKSSRSSGGASNCVEVAHLPRVVGIRDTKDRDGGHLAVAPEAWRALLERL